MKVISTLLTPRSKQLGIRNTFCIWMQKNMATLVHVSVVSVYACWPCLQAYISTPKFPHRLSIVSKFTYGMLYSLLCFLKSLIKISSQTALYCVKIKLNTCASLYVLYLNYLSILWLKFIKKTRQMTSLIYIIIYINIIHNLVCCHFTFIHWKQSWSEKGCEEESEVKGDILSCIWLRQETIFVLLHSAWWCEKITALESQLIWVSLQIFQQKENGWHTS